jgi:hypothetical protein
MVSDAHIFDVVVVVMTEYTLLQHDRVAPLRINVHPRSNSVELGFRLHYKGHLLLSHAVGAAPL